MKIRFVLYMPLLLTAILFLTYKPAQSGKDETAQKPKIALILAKPADNDQTKNGTEKSAAVEVEDAELPVQESAADYFNRGTAHDNSGMYGDAIESYKRAIMIDPDYQEAYYNLAFSYLLSNDVKSAHGEYTHLKDINPQMADDLYNKALIMVRSNPENKFAVQVGAFRNIQNANDLMDKLKANYMHTRIEAEDGFSKVRVFGMKNKEEAGLMMKDIRDKFKIDPFLVRVH